MRWEPGRTLRRHLQSQSLLKRRTRSFFLFVVLPAWLGPGFLDWIFHKRTRIEDPENGGLPESLIHTVMFAEGGIPLVLSAAFEMNPLIISMMTGSAILHEVTAMADVRVAARSQRHLSQWEQHVHSFLEVMPFCVVPLMVLLHEPTTTSGSFVRRSSALTKRDLLVTAAAITAFGLIPYAEEMLRCARTASRPPISPQGEAPVTLPIRNTSPRRPSPGRVATKPQAGPGRDDGVEVGDRAVMLEGNQ